MDVKKVRNNLAHLFVEAGFTMFRVASLVDSAIQFKRVLRTELPPAVQEALDKPVDPDVEAPAEVDGNCRGCGSDNACQGECQRQADGGSNEAV